MNHPNSSVSLVRRLVRFLHPSANGAGGLARLALVSVLAMNHCAAASVGGARQGADLLKVDLLGVFAHPDDETGVASTIAHYALGRGKTVGHAYLTRGEGGGNMVGTQSGAALGLLREVELRDCLTHLGVRHVCFLDQLDWAYTESLTATLRKWGHDETLGRVVRAVRVYRPEVIVTMNPAPNPGQHGHHQAAGILAIEAFSAAADPARYPEQLHREGLSVWQARKIYISGGGTNATATISVQDALPDGRTPAQVAAVALANHRSQAFGSFANAPWLSRPQTFTLAKSAGGYPAPETDLLADSPPGQLDLKAATHPVRGGLAFVPRPAIDNYQHWVKQQGVEHLAGRFKADLPLVAGQVNRVRVDVFELLPRKIGASATVRLEVPAGWQVARPEVDVFVRAGVPSRCTFDVTPPAGRPADGEMTATLLAGGAPSLATGIGHPVPFAPVRRVRRGPALDGTDAGWPGTEALRIAPTDLVQGRVTDDADSSASVRLAHDGRRLYVDVRVLDERVISNIASNDIKGHWRSDSVEICLDPAAGAEDTMACYKLGIFPFDATGVVRAARDADANQGLVEETAPGTRLFSTRTPDGYRVQASIPFDEIGVKPGRGRRLGFNVIVYDGDKVGALPGENINESRIAWSPRSGVQGRPEDWGRIELE